jgi:hypothetical protein
VYDTLTIQYTHPEVRLGKLSLGQDWTIWSTTQTKVLTHHSQPVSRDGQRLLRILVRNCLHTRLVLLYCVVVIPLNPILHGAPTSLFVHILRPQGTCNSTVSWSLPLMFYVFVDVAASSSTNNQNWLARSGGGWRLLGLVVAPTLQTAGRPDAPACLELRAT